MEQLLIVKNMLQASLNENLELIRTNSNNESVNQIIDEINLSVASSLSELFLLIEDKARTNAISFRPANAFLFHEGEKLVCIHARANNSGSVRAFGGFAVIWNTDHALNLSLPTMDTNVTQTSSQISAILAVVTQCKELRAKNITILTKHPIVAEVIENVQLWDRQSYTDTTGNTRAHVSLLSKLNQEILCQNLLIKTLSPDSNLRLLQIYNRLEKKAKEGSAAGAEEMRQKLMTSLGRTRGTNL